MAEERDTTVSFVKGVDEENVTQEIWKSLNQLYGQTSHLVNYKYHLILYRLAKGGTFIKEELKDGVRSKKKVVVAPLDMDTLVHATGYSRQRIHQLVTEFERREIERLHSNEDS